jgi:hypothetical protein
MKVNQDFIKAYIIGSALAIVLLLAGLGYTGYMVRQMKTTVNDLSEAQKTTANYGVTNDDLSNRLDSVDKDLSNIQDRVDTIYFKL